MKAKVSTTLKSSFLAGVSIGIAGFGFLAIGGIPGAVLFAFGLITVVSYKLKLFTGTAGFIVKGETGDLLLILLGNILGTLAVALLARVSPMKLQEQALNILTARLALGPVKCGLLAIGCGFLMTTAVTFARRGQWLPLLFAVPMFILCGFPHCIADAFYYLAAPFHIGLGFGRILVLYICIVIGNFIGCNLYRLVMKGEEKV